MVILADLLPNRCDPCSASTSNVVFKESQNRGRVLIMHLGYDFDRQMTLLGGRQCEVGRAALERMLDGSRASPQLHYVGCMRPEHSDVKTALEEIVYNDWDRSPGAPPRSRPVEAQAEPNLLLLNWSSNCPSLPDMIAQKFPESSPSYMEIMEMKKKLVEEFGQPPPRPSGTATRVTVCRAIGRPDFTIEDGSQPLDVTRALALDSIPVSTFSVERTGIEIVPFVLCLAGFELLICFRPCQYSK